MNITMTSLAMATPQGGAGGGGMLGMFLPMIFIFAIFYFMMIRPQQRKEKERRAMIDALKSGDRVLFGGGIIGVVAGVKDNILTVKVSSTVTLEILRGAVTRVLGKDDKIDSEVA
jgi:preprotein translocase subunit YajC